MPDFLPSLPQDRVASFASSCAACTLMPHPLVELSSPHQVHRAILARLASPMIDRKWPISTRPPKEVTIHRRGAPVLQKLQDPDMTASLEAFNQRQCAILLDVLSPPSCHRTANTECFFPSRHIPINIGPPALVLYCDAHPAGPSAILDSYARRCAMLDLTLSLSVCTMHSVVASAMLASYLFAANCRLGGHRHNCTFNHSLSISFSVNRFVIPQLQ